MNPEFKGNFAQKIGYHIVSRAGNVLMAGIDVTTRKDNFRHTSKLVDPKKTKWENIKDNYKLSYKLRMLEDARSPNRMAVKGWAAIIATIAAISIIRL